MAETDRRRETADATLWLLYPGPLAQFSSQSLTGAALIVEQDVDFVILSIGKHSVCGAVLGKRFFLHRDRFVQEESLGAPGASRDDCLSSSQPIETVVLEA